MPGFEYTIRRGDTLSGLAQRYSVEGGWRAIWEDDHNEELRGTRGAPNRLYPGDRVYIPGAEGNVEPAPSGGTAEFTTPPPYRIRAENGTDPPMSIIPKGDRLILTAVLDEEAEGTWAWSTDSTKIALDGETTDRVTVRSVGNVSAAAFAEVLRVSFTPADGEALPPISTRLTVIEVTFTAVTAQAYGFDGMGTNMGDATPSSENPHVSVKKNTTVDVQVTVTGGVTGGFLRFTTDDNTTAEATVDADPPASFPLHIEGKSKNKAETTIHARAGTDTGPICASLKVNVYREMSYTAKVARIHDSTSSGTTLSRPNFSIAATQTALRGYYKQAVTTITLTDYNSSGGSIDVNYDPTSSGSLVLEAGRVSTGEQRVKDALTGTGKKIVIVKKLAWLFKLGTAASIGDRTITMSSHLNATYMSYITNGSYQLGGPGNYENVTVTATNTTTRVVTLSTDLTKAHPLTEGVWWPLGGLSGNPAYVQESTDTQAKVDEVIGHEFGHELISYLDVTHAECLMHHTNSRTGQKIRFKPMTKHYTPPVGTENQWECVSRT